MLVVSIASAMATGSAFDFFSFFILSCKFGKSLLENHLKVDFRKICTERPEKTVFLAFFDIWPDMAKMLHFREFGVVHP